MRAVKTYPMQAAIEKLYQSFLYSVSMYMLVAFIICQYIFCHTQRGAWLLALTKTVTESIVQKVHISVKIIIL
jgi:hypothetical protein